MKLFKFYNYWSDFIADKISNSEDNTTYYDFDNNESVLGTPNVMYNQVCFIEDRKCIWTHGQKYTSAEAAGVSQEDLDLAIKKHTDKQPKDLVKGIAPAVNYESAWARLRHYSIQKNANGDYTDLISYFTYLERATDQATYVRDYTTYTDEEGNEQNSYTYYAYGHAGLMGVDDVRSMWQSWHAVRFMPEKLVGYTSSGADLTSAYITSYYKAEEGEEYPTIQKVFAEDGKTWTGEFVKRKELGAWKSEKTYIPLATKDNAGVINAEDKVKLDSLGILSDFTVSSESGNTTGEKILRERFSPSNSTFNDLVSVNFKKGDKIAISADLSACGKTECEMIAFGKDISAWGTGLDVNKGVFHVYHKHSGSTHTILVNYVDKNNQGGLKYNGTSGLAISGDTVDIEVGYDTDLLKPYFTINGTNLIGTSNFMTVNNMNEWLDQKSMYVGSVSEASTGKLTNVLYNYIKILKSQATSADGVKVQYSVGNDDNEFIIPNATTTTNGAMSLDDKKKLDGLKTYSVATLTEDGLMSSEDKNTLNRLLSAYNNSGSSDSSSTSSSSKFFQEFDIYDLSDTAEGIRPATIMWTAYEGGYPIYIGSYDSCPYCGLSRYSKEGINSIAIRPYYDQVQDSSYGPLSYVQVEIQYKDVTYRLNIEKMIELGLLEPITY